MPQLLVRNLEEEIVKALEERAVRHGRSAEAEHREILRQALARKPKKSFKEMLLAIPPVGDGEDFSRDDDLGRETTWVAR